MTRGTGCNFSFDVDLDKSVNMSRECIEQKHLHQKHIIVSSSFALQNYVFCFVFPILNLAYVYDRIKSNQNVHKGLNSSHTYSTSVIISCPLFNEKFWNQEFKIQPCFVHDKKVMWYLICVSLSVRAAPKLSFVGFCFLSEETLSKIQIKNVEKVYLHLKWDLLCMHCNTQTNSLNLLIKNWLPNYISGRN